MGRKPVAVVAIYFLLVMGSIRLDFGNDTPTNIFVIFNIISAFIFFSILLTEFSLFIKRNQSQNPYLTPSAIVAKTQTPEEWIEKVMDNIENGTVRERHLSPLSKRTIFRIKAETILAVIIIPSTVLISLINAWIYSQLNPGKYNSNFWTIFSTMGLVFLTLMYIFVDRLDKRRLSSQSEVTTQQGFELPKKHLQKSLNLGSAILAFTIFSFVYLYITSPKESLEYIFMLNSPILILFVILGLLSIFFIIVGIILKVNKKYGTLATYKNI